MTHDTVVSLVLSINMLFTGLRIAANVPQLLAVLRDPCGARAISVGSWTVFTLANASNGVYALVLASDMLMFAINLASAGSCAAIALAAATRQRRFRVAQGTDSETVRARSIFAGVSAPNP